MAALYKLDANKSRFTVQAFAGGMLSTFGHNPTFTIRDFMGKARFEPGVLEDSSLQLNIKADSLEVTDDISEKDRHEIERKMHEEVLETARYPEIVFKSGNIKATRISESWYRLEIGGELSLHGVTKSKKIDTRVRLSGDVLRASGSFTLWQGNYNIRRVSALGGALRVKDELKFSFDITAQKDGK